MTTAFASLVLALSLLAWLGQVITALAPRLAVRWSLTEAEDQVDPAFHADVRAEAVWDSLTLWVLVAAAVLLILHVPSWALFGLAGGGMNVYFAGRGILQRRGMRRRGIAIGDPSTGRMFIVFLTLWGLAGAATIVLASHDLLAGS